MNPPGDQAERDRALASAKNLAVTAGAGTGKTTLLVDKICRKVLQDGLKIEQILALTFTEKAANELRMRIRVRLTEAGKAEGLDRASIGTIHSFCAQVLRQFPIEAGVAPDFKVDEGPAERLRFDDRWPRWLDRELGPRARRPELWKTVLREADLETLRDLARGLCSFSIPADPGDGDATLRRMAEMAAREAPELAESLVPGPSSLVGFPQSSPPRGAAGGGDPGPRTKDQGPRPMKKPKGAGPAYASALKLVEDLAAVDAPLAGKAVSLVSDFAAEFRRGFLTEGYLTFEAMLALVRDLFRNEAFSNVLELLREKYRYILVDEFQDTDPLQSEIIELLAQGKGGKLAPGKLFIVGDPKQSIYSFRGADIIAYQRLVDKILEQGGERVVLSTNFRSHGKILDFINDVFSKVIVERDPLQPAYERIEPRQGREPELPGPHLEAVLIEDAKADQSREAEAEVVAEWIASHPSIPRKSIAILFRALTVITPYIEALRAREIPYIVTGEKYFYGTTEVIDFVNLLRAAASPHDRVAVAGVLRSPYGALSDQDLYDRRKSLDYRLPSDIPLFPYLKRWHELSGKIGVGELIQRIFEESYALEIAQASYHGEQAVANLLKLQRKAADLEAQGGCTLREFLDVSRRAIADLEEEGESPLADEALDAVSVLTIHASKGLEYPVVILPDLHHELRGSSREPAVRYDWPTGTRGVRLGDLCDAGGAALRYLDRERKREEEKRLLYVAVTRAREAVVFLGSANAKSNSYLPMLLPELERRDVVRSLPYKPSPPPAAPPPVRRERPEWRTFVEGWREREKRAVVVERFTSPSKLEEEQIVDRLLNPGAEDAPVSSSRAIEVGIECHKVLEHLDFNKPRVPDGVDPESAEILSGFFKSPAFGELAGAEILARELPFLLPRGPQILQGVIDVVYRRGGIVTVGDYKTDRIMQPEEYALIRDIYTEAVRRALNVEPRFKLFYLRQGREVEV